MIGTPPTSLNCPPCQMNVNQSVGLLPRLGKGGGKNSSSRLENSFARPGENNGSREVNQLKMNEGKSKVEKRLLTVNELWEKLGFATNKEVNASEGRVKKVRALLEKHRGVFISPGRTVGRAPSEFESVFEAWC